VTDGQPLPGGGACLDILIVFTGYRTSAERFETVLGVSPSGEDDSIELELRLVREILRRARGHEAGGE